VRGLTQRAPRFSAVRLQIWLHAGVLGRVPEPLNPRFVTIVDVHRGERRRLPIRGAGTRTWRKLGRKVTRFPPRQVILRSPSMPKSKPKATIMVAGANGDLVPVQDRRFDPPRDWPIQFEVAAGDADLWLRYFYDQCARHGWSSGGIGQIDRSENSGSISVNQGSPDKPQLAVVWERQRNRPMRVRARSEGQPETPLADMRAYFDEVNGRCASRAVEQVYRRRTLEYYGLVWRGEYWLDDTVRLGPPSLQYDKALFGPRAIVVDALVECIGAGDATGVFDRQLRELAAFLSVVMGTNVRVTTNGRPAWSWEQGRADCAVRSLGYWESEQPTAIPARGTASPVPLRTITRPDFAHRGLEEQTRGEAMLPSDIGELWDAYRALSPELRQQFLQAAAKWQEAAMLFSERDTLSVALMVVACEALKPADQRYRDHNIYQVVEALLGLEHARRLDVGWFRAQEVRSSHVHAGEFHGSEFVDAAMHSSYQDPTFDEARRALWPVTQESIIEWLRRGGSFTMPPLRRAAKSQWRKPRDRAFALVPVAAIAGIVAGWFLRSSWPS
jgi:hypothetical protein